ncbi:hypothetical protein [Clostridium thermobutyricum]|uniref:hypothetical protein n=1 Tax=Clostridium thermobutyricum TaxID=29372 RepID=UPI003F51FBDB
MNKYLYTPQDISLFFDYSDFRISDEKAIQEIIWEQRNEILDKDYTDDKHKFIKAILKNRELCDIMAYKNEVLVINRIMKELGSSYEISKLNYGEDYIEAFFRFIKLRLTYTRNCSYVRLKLRRLLRNFGYKRRTKMLINNIQRSMDALNLECYIKNYQHCNINEIKLDDFMIIRLKSSNSLKNKNI